MNTAIAITEAIIHPVATILPGERCRSILSGPGLRHGDGRPPEAGAESLGTATKVLRFAPFQHPDEESDRHCETKQHRDGLEESEREKRPSDRDPGVFVDRYRNAEPGVVKRLCKIDLARTLGSYCNRRDANVESAVCDAVQQIRHALGFDQAKT
ncbi:hypothetical protein ABIF03_004086 [Bradyrhizobium elkanii]